MMRTAIPAGAGAHHAGVQQQRKTDAPGRKLESSDLAIGAALSLHLVINLPLRQAGGSLKSMLRTSQSRDSAAPQSDNG